MCTDYYAPNRPSSNILDPTRLVEMSDLLSDFLSADACIARSCSSTSVKRRDETGPGLVNRPLSIQGCLADVCVFLTERKGRKTLVSLQPQRGKKKRTLAEGKVK